MKSNARFFRQPIVVEEYEQRYQPSYEQDPSQSQALAIRPGANPVRQPVPPIRTPEDIKAAREANELISAMRVVKAATREIAEEPPSDEETYAMLLALRASFVRGKEQFIENMAKTGYYGQGLR